MIGIYLSGTGNTKHCVEKLLSIIEPGAEAFPLESEISIDKIKESDSIILGYPTQFSNIPYMVRDYINKNSSIWSGKKIFCVSTMALFSGDGAGCAARLLKKYNAEIIGGLHLLMPDSIGDVKLLKKSVDKNHQTIVKTDEKIEQVGKKIREEGIYPKEGLSFPYHMAGLFGQRLWFYNKTTGYTDKVKINDSCVGCGLCSKLCPMNNLEIKDGKAVAGPNCTMCYRCIDNCPKQAITLLGKKVHEQCKYEKYC